MSIFLIYALLWFWDNRSFDAVTDANIAIERAQEAYYVGDYATAADLYGKISSEFIFNDPSLRINMAHAQFLSGDIPTAEKQYQLLTKSDNRRIATNSQIQLGMIALEKKDTLQALSYLKSAMNISPAHEMARYNYEVLKRRFSGKEEPSEAGINENNFSKVQKSSELQDKPVQIPESATQNKEMMLDRLSQLNLSEEETQAILDAMKANELQYIYQLRRKQHHSAIPAGKNKVEW